MNHHETDRTCPRRWRARRALGVLLAVALLSAWHSVAGAQERAPQRTTPAPRSRVVTISEVTIVGRIQKPIAAVDVSRIQPKLTLAELRQPFLQGIEKAIYSSPF